MLDRGRVKDLDGWIWRGNGARDVAGPLTGP